MAKKVLTQNLSEPLQGATSAAIDIGAGSGNLEIGTLSNGEPVLASATLEYLESQVPPTPAITRSGDRASLTLRAAGARRPSFKMPWSSCNGETDWRILLNPKVRSDITAHSGGGNVKLNLAGMLLTRVAADTGGGNMDVVLPDKAASLDVVAQSGAGNVTVELGSGITGCNSVNATSGAGNVAVRVPSGIAVRIQATTGMGKAIIDPAFSQVDKFTYQSPDYDNAADKVEISMKSGAGNVIVTTKER